MRNGDAFGACAALALAAGSALSCGGGAPAPVAAPSAPSAAPRPAADLPAEEDPAHIEVLSPRGTAEIRLDGKPIGHTPITHHAVTPGRHDVTFVYGPGDEQTLSVTVKAGRETTVKLDHMPPIKDDRQ